MWLREYMVERSAESNFSASLPYSLLILRIIVHSLVDLSAYKSTLIDATYDTRTFSNIGYVLIDAKCYKKESVQQKPNTSKATRITTDFACPLL